MSNSRCCVLNSFKIFLAVFLATITIPAWSISKEPWHVVLVCQSRTDVSPMRPGYRLKLPNFIFENDKFTVRNSYEESANSTVNEVWEGRVEQGKILISARVARNANDWWTYELISQGIEGDSINFNGNLISSSGKKIRECSLNMTTLVSDLTKTWDGLSEKAPTEYLISNGQRWHHQTTSSNSPSVIFDRTPTQSETLFLKKVDEFFSTSSAKAIAVIDGNSVIYSDTRFPSTRFSRFLSFSMGKSVTSLAIGKAICEGKLTLETKVESILPDFLGSPIGSSNVRNLLMMSSGTWEGFPDSSITTLADDQNIREGRISYIDLLKSNRVNSQASNRDGSVRKPGTTFAYHSTDPLVLGLLINKVSGKTYAQYVESEVLLPAGIRHSAIIGQDQFGYGSADGNVRLRLEDWIRLAIWIGATRQGNDCLADYIKQAASTQIINSSQKIGPNFSGYGYLFWTNNFFAPNTFWATGHGGQAIGWNYLNNKIMIVFSTSDDVLTNFYRLYNEWVNLK